MSILGISAGFHDAAITLIRNGEILFAGHSERYSKKKHDSELCSGLIADCIFNYGYPSEIAYYERPWLKKTRQLYAGQWSELTKNWSVRDMLYNAAPWANLDTLPITTHSHHLSHAAAGFQTSPYNDATVVVIDAIGEWDTISMWDARYDRHGQASYTKLWSQKYPHSIGLMYSALTKRAGLIPLDEEYILMGMAGYGTTMHKLGWGGDPSSLFKQWLVDDEVNLTFNYNLHIGVPDSIILEGISEYDIAAHTQALLEDLVANVMHKANSNRLGNSRNLVYMGGVALNCLANRSLGYYFDNIWIMPNPGDAGSSLGAAALAYRKKLDWKNAFLGHNISGDYPVNAILSELVTSKIAGVASGRAEFGPRALGNRSLLADPRGAEIKDKVNEIKQRQKFRPFAPIILEEHVHEYFDMPQGFNNSPYMQVVAKCKYPEQFPAIVHVDNTSRVQTVANDGSGIRKLLEKWFVWTGCPMLLNTSLNIRGEPMVNDRNDADRFEERYGIKVLS